VSALAKDEPEPVAGKTTVSRKNQITLPVAVLRAAHVTPGDRLRVEAVRDGVVQLVREKDPWMDALEELIGSAPGISKAANLEELRNEWER
jgi:bifunctional DNA-binding transcriptional regulator/antitoxin component of YhaV-PrlF toxin-antitoxin module